MLTKNYIPWRFRDDAVEAEYAAERAVAFARADQAVGVPWLFLWLSLLRRNWHALPYATLLGSLLCNSIVTSPSWLQVVLGSARYRRYRVAVVLLAKTAYIFHPGGGLYRDGQAALGNSALGAANLFVRLAVGSRTLFWLVLAFGFQLPLHLQVPLDAVQLGLLMWMKPSASFCALMQNDASAPVLRSIAAALPLVSLIPLARPQLVEGADVCNPLTAWMQVGLGYLLPVLVHVCTDIIARRRFAARRQGGLPRGDAGRWLASKRACQFNPWTIFALVYPHALTALWYALMWNQIQFPYPARLAPDGGTAAATAASAVSAS